MQQEKKLVKQFDQDGDKRLNVAERQAAREFLAKERTEGRGQRGPGFRGRGGNETPVAPGRKISPADVEPVSNVPLYDPQTVRTLFLDFENSDWEKELADFKNTDVEVPATLTVDGKRYPDVGVHFRGMSSFMMVGEGHKRSLNLALDFAHKDQQLGGYRTLNLLNSHEDPTFLRTVLAQQIAREYLPAPKANFVRVVINGENWGLYVNSQQFNKDFTKEWFGTTKGARWKVEGSPGGHGGLNYIDDEVKSYRSIYTIKTKDDAKSWGDLIRLCKVLNETPPAQLEAALSPLLDIDGVLKFLALENVLVNNDGYWVRSSDYNLYEDEKGRFHVIPHDVNETFSSSPGGGPGGPGGRGGFGLGMMLAPRMLAEGDQDKDQKLSAKEFAALGDAWFDTLDADKAGQVSQEQFSTKLSDLLPPPPGFGSAGSQNGPPGNNGPRGGFGPAGFIGPGLFTTLDVDKDGALTRAELKEKFAGWFAEWDGAKSGSIDEAKLREGLNTALPRPNFGGRGRGGPGGGGGGFAGGPPGGPGGGPGGGFGPGMMGGGVDLDPLVGLNDASKPLRSKLLAVPALRARYLGYVRDLAQNWLDWEKLGPVALAYQSLIRDYVKDDTRKLESFEAFEQGIAGVAAGTPTGTESRGGRESASLKSFAEKRRAFLLNHAALKTADQ